MKQVFKYLQNAQQCTRFLCRESKFNVVFPLIHYIWASKGLNPGDLRDFKNTWLVLSYAYIILWLYNPNQIPQYLCYNINVRVKIRCRWLSPTPQTISRKSCLSHYSPLFSTLQLLPNTGLVYSHQNSAFAKVCNWYTPVLQLYSTSIFHLLSIC